MAKKGRRLSPKQRAAAIRNLKKARRARGSGRRKRSSRTTTRKSTIKARRVTNVARKKKSSSSTKPMFKFGGMRLYNNDIYEVLGVGAAGAVGGIANTVSGGRVTGNLAQTAGGMALALFGGRRGAQVGEGVLKKTLGDWVEDNIVPFVAGAGSGNSGNTGSNDGW